VSEARFTGEDLARIEHAQRFLDEPGQQALRRAAAMLIDATPFRETEIHGQAPAELTQSRWHGDNLMAEHGTRWEYTDPRELPKGDGDIARIWQKAGVANRFPKLLPGLDG